MAVLLINTITGFALTSAPAVAGELSGRIETQPAAGVGESTAPGLPLVSLIK